MPVEKQIVLIWTATNGYLDILPIELLDKFEKEFFPEIENKYPELLEEISVKKELTPEINAALKKAIDVFVNNFKVNNNIK